MITADLVVPEKCGTLHIYLTILANIDADTAENGPIVAKIVDEIW